MHELTLRPFSASCQLSLFCSTHVYQVLATAVRMCKWDKILTVRAEAAETLGM